MVHQSKISLPFFFFPADMTDDPLTTTTYLETTPFFHLYKLFF